MVRKYRLPLVPLKVDLRRLKIKHGTQYVEKCMTTRKDFGEESLIMCYTKKYHL